MLEKFIFVFYLIDAIFCAAKYSLSEQRIFLLVEFILAVLCAGGFWRMIAR